MKYQKFTKAEAGRFRNELEAHMKPFLEARGLSLSLGNARFNDGSIRFVGPEFSIPEVKSEKATSNVRSMLVLIGVIPPNEPIRDEYIIHMGGRHYVIEDFRHRAPKRPWVAKCRQDGKSYVFPDEMVKAFLVKN